MIIVHQMLERLSRGRLFRCCSLFANINTHDIYVSCFKENNAISFKSEN